MLIARAPVRISLAGGGTDLPAYYQRHAGLVVSATITRYVYAIVEAREGNGLQITSSDYSTFFRLPPEGQLDYAGDLRLARATLHHLGLTSGIELFLASEVPPGTGLGSSGAATVSMLTALTALLGRTPPKDTLAEEACTIEIDKLGAPIGKQDQYAAAFGGLNAIEFSAEGVTVEPLALQEETWRALEQRILLFFTGSTRNSASILSEQNRSSQQDHGVVVETLHHIRRMAEEVRSALEAGETDRVGELLHESWERKKRLASGISNPAIDKAYGVARAHGALGGKITGAGGGGFLLLYCPPAQCDAVTRSLEDGGLKRMDFRFDHGGACLLLDGDTGLGHTMSPAEQSQAGRPEVAAQADLLR